MPPRIQGIPPAPGRSVPQPRGHMPRGHVPTGNQLPGQGITLLGAQATGKTTFLAALQIALLRQDLGWSLRGDNPGSTQALVTLTSDVTDNKVFPRPTGAIENYRWSLDGELPRAVKERHWWGFRRKDLHVTIPLDLVDAPGESADGNQMFGRAISRQFVDNLARSAGIVLFFDPVSEFERGDAFRHTYGVLTQLKSQLGSHGRLPHYVAVCITKFDEIRVLESAQKLKLVEYDPEPPEFPKVPGEYAREFFTRLCRLSRTDNAELVLPLLEQTFRKERIRFFVTSAIGFYVDQQLGVFDPEDYQNHIPKSGDEKARIRGAVHPINVVEPILWLGRNVARTAGEWTTGA
jgi:hypothetical protein